MKPPVWRDDHIYAAPDCPAIDADFQRAREALNRLPPLLDELPKTNDINALRHLLDRAQVTPEDVARLGFGVLERAPGVGRQSIEVIRAWLRKYGLDLQGQARETKRLRDAQRQRKLEQAIRLLQKYGYEIRPPKQPTEGTGAEHI